MHFYNVYLTLAVFTLLLLSPTPEITWLKKEGELDESRTTKSMFDRHLTIKNISESDSGEYQCIAKNTQGNAKHTYHLKVEGVFHSILYRNKKHLRACRAKLLFFAALL